MKRPTIKDIASAAGVSPTAVSFAFNHPERLPEETLNRILALAAELNYSPHPIARSMTSGRIGALGLLLANPLSEILQNPFFYEFLEGFGESCAAGAFSIKIIPPYGDGLRHGIVNAAVDGMATLGVDPSYSVMVALRQRGVPFVMVDTDPTDGVPVVNIDDEKGAFAQMEHVLKLGHRRIAIFGIRSGLRGKYENYIGTLRRRVSGYLAALEKFNLSIDGREVCLIESPSTAEGGKRALQELWKTESRPSVVVCMCDAIALGAMDAARLLGVDVPVDLSIIGFDDVRFSALVTPGLTTVYQPLRRKGKLAGEMLLNLIEGKSESARRILRTRLVIRATVGPPRA